MVKWLQLGRTALRIRSIVVKGTVMKKFAGWSHRVRIEALSRLMGLVQQINHEVFGRARNHHRDDSVMQLGSAPLIQHQVLDKTGMQRRIHTHG